VDVEKVLDRLSQRGLTPHLPLSKDIDGRGHTVVQDEEPVATPPDVEAVAVESAGGDAARHRQHRFPGRDKVVKVRYDADEHAAVASAAGQAGLTTAGFVASAALAAATDSPPPTQAPLRELLSELLAARTALRRYAVNVNQAVRRAQQWRRGAGVAATRRRRGLSCGRPGGRGHRQVSRQLP